MGIGSGALVAGLFGMNVRTSFLRSVSPGHTRASYLVDESLRKSSLGLLRHDRVRYGARRDGRMVWPPNVSYLLLKEIQPDFTLRP
jgi:hypothetical protein